MSDNVDKLITLAVDLQNECDELHSKIDDLVRYLNSDKFSKDPTVQVVDVLTRLGRR